MATTGFAESSSERMDAVALAGIGGGAVTILSFFGLSGRLSLRSAVDEVHEQVHPNHGTSFRDEVLREVRQVGGTAQQAATSAALAAQRAETVGQAVTALANRQTEDENRLSDHIGYHRGVGL